MVAIRPVTDLKSHLLDIMDEVHVSNEPVFLTKDGYGDAVILSMQAWNASLFENEIYMKLRESELEEEMNPIRFTHEEVFGPIRERIKVKMNNAV
jgi:PHD/YefM family antitoxin component YafN of YafNO toxin-antitoxin module